jgi:hypothetical protein
MPKDQEQLRHYANRVMTTEDLEPIVRPVIGGFEKQVSIKIAARRLLELAPAEPKIELYCRGFRVTIERGDFIPPDGW